MPNPRNPDPEKFCNTCGKKLTRKRYGGTLEDMGAFRRRKYCDRVCMALGQQKPEPSRSAIQKRLRRFRSSSCGRCGATANLAIHHKDGDWRNNDPSNLETLCGSCHTALHHSQGDLVTRRPVKPCKVCGRPSYRKGLCGTHLTRLKRHGSPYLKKIKTGQSWRLVSVDGGPNGPESPE